jgi:hypothetical protein
MRLRMHEAELRWWQHDYDAAEASFAAIRDEASQVDAPAWIGFSSYGSAFAAWERGDAAASESHARSALAIATRLELRALATGAGTLLGICRARLGDAASAHVQYRLVAPTPAELAGAHFQIGLLLLLELELARIATTVPARAELLRSAASRLDVLVAPDEHGARPLERGFAMHQLARILAPALAEAGLDARDRSASRAPSCSADGTQLTRHDGRIVSLAKRPTLARVLAALAAREGEVVTFEELERAGWPDDRARSHSLRARLRVAVSTLRRMGLGEAIVTEPTGYRLDLRR